MLMAVEVEDGRDARERRRHACRTRDQQWLTPEAVDEAHPNHCEQKVGHPKSDRLLSCRCRSVAGTREDVVRVVQDGVNAGELVEQAER